MSTETRLLAKQLITKLTCTENTCQCKFHLSDLESDLSLGLAVSAREGVVAMDDNNINCQVINELLCVFARIRCVNCGMRLDITLTSPTTYAVSSGSAEYPVCRALNLSWDFELAVPSGKIILANDLRHAFSKKTREVTDTLSISNKLGMWQHTKAFADLQMIYAFSGNSSPSIFQQGNNITVTNVDEDECYNEETDLVEYSSLNIGEYKGYICTDLWAVTAMDYSTLIEVATNNLRIGDAVDYINQCDTVTLDVEPGIYQFNTPCAAQPDNEDYDLPKLIIKRIRDL